MNAKNRPLQPAFTFAGFTFPRYLSILPRGDIKRRIERYKNPVCGNYYSAPKPLARGDSGKGGYFENGQLFGLRFEYCDDIAQRINHTGWYTDEYGDRETIRGVVFRLNHNKGFVIGWTMGEGMASCIEYGQVYSDEITAAYAADSLAERQAEKERQYNEAYENGRQFAEKGAEIKDIKKDFLAIRREYKKARHLGEFPSLCSALREKLLSMLRDIRKLKKEREALGGQWYSEYCHDAFNAGKNDFC